MHFDVSVHPNKLCLSLIYRYKLAFQLGGSVVYFMKILYVYTLCTNTMWLGAYRMPSSTSTVPLSKQFSEMSEDYKNCKPKA